MRIAQITVLGALLVSGIANAQYEIVNATPFVGSGGLSSGLRAMDVVPDTNGDGVADIVIGDESADPPGSNPLPLGWYSVVSGRDGSNLYSTFVPQFGIAGLGAWVAGCGDVNGDGRGDYMVGSPGSPPSTGVMRIHSGSDHAVLWTEGTIAPYFVGRAGSGAGDMDGDSKDDFAIGSHLFPGGKIRTRSGATGQVFFELTGPVLGFSIGDFMDTAGDVNMDGYPDLVSGTTGPVVVVYSGVDGSILHQFPNAPDGVVSSAGDVDGDGFDDIVAGQYNQKYTVWSGATGVIITEDAAVQNGFGAWVDDCGDVDVDGDADVIVGIPDAPVVVPFGSWVGAGIARVLDGNDASVVMEARGSAPQQHFGQIVSGADDLNLDGFGDIVVTQPIVTTEPSRVRGFVGCFGTAVQYGQGCGGTPLPTLSANDCIVRGAPFELRVKNVPLQQGPFAIASLVIGPAAGITPVGLGCSLLVSPPVPINFPILVAGQGVGSGSFEFVVPLEIAPIIVNIQAYSVSTSGSLAMTNGLSLSIF